MDVLSVNVVAAWAALAVLTCLQAAVLWRLRRLATRAGDSGERVERLAGALSMLTDTSEAGFRAVSAELERLGAARAAGPPDTVDGARIERAARRGRSVAQIAAAEQMSEGEVRLRLHLADPAAVAPPAKRPARPARRKVKAARTAA